MKAKTPHTKPPSAPVIHWMIRANVIHQVTDLIGDVWVLRLVNQLLQAPQRFESLIQALTIPRSTLSARLRTLTDQGCLERDANHEQAYALTAQGRDLLPLLRQMQQWNRRWEVPGWILEDASVPNPCGHDAPLHMHCSHCSGDVDARHLHVLQTHRHPSMPPETQARRARVPAPIEDSAPLSAEELMGDRWTGLILGAAFFRAQRFSDIEQALSIATNILSTRLARLVQQGMLDRANDSMGGERPVYQLTERGLSYYPVIAAALAWGERWLAPDYDPGWRVLHIDCLEWFTPTFVCATCAQPA